MNENQDPPKSADNINVTGNRIDKKTKSGGSLRSTEKDEKAKQILKKDPARSAFGSAVDFLKDIKELVAIMVFFALGAVWIYAAFATKQHVASVRCLLASTIERIDNEAQSRELKQEIVDAGVRQQLIKGKGSLSAEDILEAETLEVRKKELENKKSMADKAVKESSTKILQGACEQ